jgi:segregation and condensation protein A
MPLQEDYQVALESFHGPLDLLLYLIRRAEVDVEDIPIAAITDQYLDFLRRLDDIDIDMAGEFLVMAATLVEIKSRVLMPAEARGGDGSEGGEGGEGRAADQLTGADPRRELIQQLLAYQKFRITADELDARRRAFEQRYAVRPARVSRDATEQDEDGVAMEAAEVLELELDDVHALDLSEAYERIASSIDFARLGDHTIEIDDTPIALHQEDLIDRLGRAAERTLRLQDAFEGQSAGGRIGLFLAALELVRLRRISVRQDDIEGDVLLVLEDAAEQ